MSIAGLQLLNSAVTDVVQLLERVLEIGLGQRLHRFLGQPIDLLLTSFYDRSRRGGEKLGL